MLPRLLFNTVERRLTHVLHRELHCELSHVRLLLERIKTCSQLCLFLIAPLGKVRFDIYFVRVTFFLQLLLVCFQPQAFTQTYLSLCLLLCFFLITPLGFVRFELCFVRVTLFLQLCLVCFPPEAFTQTYLQLYLPLCHDLRTKLSELSCLLLQKLRLLLHPLCFKLFLLRREALQQHLLEVMQHL